jgi:hypothetical protein
MPDKGLFIAAAMFGFGTIVALKLVGYNADLVAAWAVVLMIAYGVFAYRFPLVRMRMDRLGDNFYYLGFIFTLASLSAALIQLRSNTAQFESLLGSFGIALITTIFGIALRVMFVQMRSEIDQIEEETRRDLLAASETLRAQLALTLRDFQVFQKGIHQAQTELLSGTAAISREQMQQVGSVAQGIAGVVKESLAANTAQAKSVQDAVLGAAKAIEELSRRVSTMSLPSEQLESQLAALSSQIDAMLASLRQVLQEIAYEARRRRQGWWSRLWF